MTPPKLLLGAKLRAERERIGVKQKDVAAAVGVVAVSVSRWERDEVEPGLGEFVRLSQYFGRPLTWFLDEGPGDVGAASAPNVGQLVLEAKIAWLRDHRDAIAAQLTRFVDEYRRRFGALPADVFATEDPARIVADDRATIARSPTTIGRDTKRRGHGDAESRIANDSA
jgi:transcriptional regulator with XRE-family HTH domain